MTMEETRSDGEKEILTLPATAHHGNHNDDDIWDLLRGMGKETSCDEVIPNGTAPRLAASKQQMPTHQREGSLFAASRNCDGLETEMVDTMDRGTDHHAGPRRRERSSRSSSSSSSSSSSAAKPSPLVPSPQEHTTRKLSSTLSTSSSHSTTSAAPKDEEQEHPAAFTKVFDKRAVPSEYFFLPAQMQKGSADACNAERAHNVGVTCEKIEGAEAWILDNVLSEEECALLRSQAESAGFTYWDTEREASTNPPAQSRDDFRTAFTVETHVPELANVLWERIRPFMDTIDITKESPKHERDIEGEWYPCGVNPHWLFSRYINGGHFSPHTDGNTILDFNTRTMHTMLCYLSASDDGHTRIFDDKQMCEPFTLIDGKLRGNPEHVIASVAPRVGRILIFYHRLMHEGNPAVEKYIIRTDCVYERRPALCTADEDKEAFRLYLEAQEKSEKGLCNEAMVLFRRAFRMSPGLSKIYGQ